MADTVYIVLGENGEYSDRDIWISGVFLTEAEAQAAVNDRLAARRIYEHWGEAKSRELKKLGYDWASPGSTMLCGYSEARNAEASAKLPPEPPYERAERCEIIPAKIGEWINS